MALTQQSAHRKDAGKVAGMQHRHFATIATVIAELQRQHGADKAHTPEQIAAHFAHMLGRINTKFDRERFLRACQP